ncbi:MAG: VCBS repeat-containing protein [Planctomycetes bacterium]|nr:VCBS repeat-containing protein [Planctomycetota bacterium]
MDCNENGLPDREDIRGGPVVLEGAKTIETGRFPLALALLHLNSDASLDLVCANWVQRDLTVFHGSSVGELRKHASYPLEHAPAGILSADFDGDDFGDLLVTSRESPNALTFHASGDGTLGPAVKLATGGFVQMGDIADFDGDGAIDLGLASEGKLRLLRGDGAGAFLAPTSSDLGLSISWLDMADLNADGKPDVVVVDESATLAGSFFGHGDGTFERAELLRPDDHPWRVLTTDVNADGNADVVTANKGGRNVSLFLGDAAGKLSQRALIQDRREPYAVASQDLNGDGAFDLVVAARSDHLLSVLHGQVRGGLVETGVYYTARWPNALAIGDISGDGFMEILVTVEEGDSIWILKGDGLGRFTPPAWGARLWPIGLAPGDFNGDGALDIASGNSGSEGVSIFIGDGRGRLESSRTYARGLPPSPTPELLAVDLNGDQLLDLAAARNNSRFVLVLLGRPDGSFDGEVLYDVGANPTDLVVGDFNHDSIPDLATANYGSSDVAVLLGRGDGSFLSPVSIPVAGNPLSLATADFDRDGNLDLVTAGSYGSMILLFGRDDASFGRRSALPVSLYPRSFAAADLDGDGSADIVAVERNLSVLMNRGDGTFDPPREHEAGTGFVRVVVADMNRDGLLDLLAGSSGNTAILVLVGTADKSFRGAERFRIPYGVPNPATADFDGDAVLDVVVPAEGVVFLRNGTRVPTSSDCNANDAPDECDIRQGLSRDVDSNGTPDSCQPDCDANGLPDEYEVTALGIADCNGNTRPDSCDVTGGTSADVNGNSLPDECESGFQVTGDCNQDGDLDVSDALCLLGVLFDGKPELFPCGAGTPSDLGNVALLDWQSDRVIDISDAIALLHFLFLADPAPFVVPGGDGAGSCRAILGCPDVAACMELADRVGAHAGSPEGGR